MSLGRQHVLPATQARIREVGYVITHQELASLKIMVKRIKNMLAGEDAPKVVDQYIEMMNVLLDQIKVPPNERSGIDLEAEYPVLKEINQETRFKKLL